ncbi:hypothetical protein GCM10011380_21510 [Sphingomonas metalli]|uniref:Methyltransferase domain-containing protein n=1 Tax=Sphingomonas metalli TaxID=1779358 RepID=A0A916WSZ5_9SPHN|nr:class I SAM-dependent methyltransferase [Sphingomonas metalli]GGB31825.1 hypothetical protein GCM10011380_21510 [Sphingomonas metalli]
MTRSFDWQARVGDVWAEDWQRTDRAFAGLVPHFDAAILAAAPGAGGRVVDIGCGAGSTALALADARPDLVVHGVDLSPALLAVARHRDERGAVQFVEGDVLTVVPSLAPVDLYVSRHGVMFFADPAAALARLANAARPGAALVFSCFAAPADNPWSTLITPPPAPRDPPPPGPFAFADPQRVAALLRDAGWHAEEPARIDFAYRVGAGEDPVADAVDFLSRIGPAATVLREARPADRPALVERLAAALADHRHGSCVELPAAAWIWRARRIGAGEAT